MYKLLSPNSKKKDTTRKPTSPPQKQEAGFSLVEVVIAMVILLIAVMGVFITFTYAVNYNAGNNSRSEALAILQQEVELMRSAKFTPQITDSTLVGGARLPRIVTATTGNRFIVVVEVDDQPGTAGIQIDNTATIKEVKVTVSLARPTPGWQTAVPATVVLLRVRSN